MIRTTLYRFYDADERLLYIGIAGNPGRRFEQHASTKDWWIDVASVRLEHHVDRVAAEAAEVAAIESERPTYNVAGNLHGSCVGCGAQANGLSIYCSQECAKATQKANRDERLARQRGTASKLTLAEISAGHKRALAKLRAKSIAS